MKALSNFGIIEENVSLKDYNTYKIDTLARYLLHPKSISDLSLFLKYAREHKIDFLVLGNGSNIVLSDSAYPSVVIKLDHLKGINYNHHLVSAEAGVMINKLGYDLVDHGLKGLEWATGIPGTIGGSVFGNAGAYNMSTFDHLKTVTYLDYDGNMHILNKDEISHGYRTTAFKEKHLGIIVSALFEFEDGNKEESMALIMDRLQRRVSSQPLELPNAGSVFRNPSQDLPSGKLIDDLGLKGFRVNDACISEKHANFIVNLGHATGKDIRSLIQLVRDKVKNAYGIDLILEQELIDWGNNDEESKEDSQKA